MGRVPWGCFGWLPTLTARAALRMASLLPGLLIATDDLPCMQVLTTARPLFFQTLLATVLLAFGLLATIGNAPSFTQREGEARRGSQPT
jgi:hypothetical protein